MYYAYHQPWFLSIIQFVFLRIQWYPSVLNFYFVNNQSCRVPLTWSLQIRLKRLGTVQQQSRWNKGSSTTTFGSTENSSKQYASSASSSFGILSLFGRFCGSCPSARFGLYKHGQKESSDRSSKSFGRFQASCWLVVDSACRLSIAVFYRRRLSNGYTLVVCLTFYRCAYLHYTLS